MVETLPNESSEIRLAAYELLKIIDEMALMSVTNPVIRKFWVWFAKNYAYGAINRVPDNELKARLERAYKLIKPIFEKVDTAQQLKSSINLNDKAMTEKLMQLPDFHKVMELVNEYDI